MTERTYKKNYVVTGKVPRNSYIQEAAPQLPEAEVFSVSVCCSAYNYSYSQQTSEADGSSLLRLLQLQRLRLHH